MDFCLAPAGPLNASLPREVDASPHCTRKQVVFPDGRQHEE